MSALERKKTLRNGFPEIAGNITKEGRLLRRKKEFYAKLSGSVLYFFDAASDEGKETEHGDSNFEKQIGVHQVSTGTRNNEIVIIDSAGASHSIFILDDMEFNA